MKNLCLKMIKMGPSEDLGKVCVHTSLSSFQSLPAWKVASTGPHRALFLISCWGGAVDSPAFSSSANLKKLWSSLGIEVSTQPDQDL